jgi:hypothetical protein
MDEPKTYEFSKMTDEELMAIASKDLKQWPHQQVARYFGECAKRSLNQNALKGEASTDQQETLKPKQTPLKELMREMGDALVKNLNSNTATPKPEKPKE